VKRAPKNTKKLCKRFKNKTISINKIKRRENKMKSKQRKMPLKRKTLKS